ncbi:MAG: T9SS type A sorting domain-containing protein [Flavobacteriales bacterium]
MNQRLTPVLCVAALLATQRGAAQADLCTGATLIACGASISGNTTAFTADVAPFCTVGDGTGGGVWFRFVGTGASTTASLCGSGFDTQIRVYTGGCGALACVVGNDDFCGLRSQVTWLATLGTTYRILVYGFGAATGAYTLNLTCAPPPVPMCYSQAPVPYSADPYAGTALVLTDDVHSAAINLGFNFCFNGTTYNRCVISSNNYITFNLANAGLFSPWDTQAIPATAPTEPQNAVLDPWQDIDPGVGGSVFYQTLGAAPNRRFVVSYLNVPMFSCTTQMYSSQIVLYEGSNCIESLILNKPVCAGWNNGEAVQGLQNNGGTSATVVAGRNNTQWTAVSEGRFFSPTCLPCSTATSAQCLNSSLPIELLRFQGRDHGVVNILEWATASEQNSEHFTVERSNDGGHFVPVLQVGAAGNSGSVIDYSANDPTPGPGINYYRLRTTDLDGSSELSDVIAVNNDHAGSLVVYPNPGHGNAHVVLPEGLHMPVELVVRDLSGRVVRNLSARHTGDIVLIEGLTGGSYSLEAPGTSAMARFVVE